jgi:hypothetical protein
VHQLTIDYANAPAAITAHPSFDEAHRALLTYAISADYYLWAIGSADFHTCYQLLRLADPGGPGCTRHPHITGTATIEELPDRQCCGQPPTVHTGPRLRIDAP